MEKAKVSQSMENNQELFSTQGISLQELEERKEMLIILEFDINAGEYHWFPEC